MDGPPIRYARMEDGTSVGYWVTGSGPALLHLDPPGQTFDSEWDHEPLASWYSMLAETFTLVRPHMPTFPSLAVARDRREQSVSILDAVLTAEDIEACVVLGVAHSTPVALLYGALRPSNVTHLVLWNPYADGEMYAATSPAYQIRNVAAIDFELWGQMMSLLAGVGSWEELTARSGLRTRPNTDEVIDRLEAAAEVDVTDLVPLVNAPTIAFHAKDARFVGLEASKQMAELLPDCEFHMVAASGGQPWSKRPSDFALAISEFAGGAASSTVAPQGFQTILFTDLESSTALTQRLGDEGAQALLRGHNDAVRAALEAHDGREVKHTGDGIMASFPSAVSAVQAALAMQRDLAGGEVRVRIGLNAGEPIAEDDDFFGTAVQLAARITDRAEPGQVLVSNVVRELCAGKGFEFTSVGDATLKGFDEPVALFEVRA